MLTEQKVTCYWFTEVCNNSVELKSLFESTSGAVMSVTGPSQLSLKAFAETSHILYVSASQTRVNYAKLGKSVFFSLGNDTPRNTH
jgi:hypothetical protein